MDENSPQAEEQIQKMSWDERRKLIRDILHLSPPDLSGILLLIKSSSTTSFHLENLLQQEQITQWDEQTYKQSDVKIPKPHSSSYQPIQLLGELNLDQADPVLLHDLRRYVDNCFIPQYIQKENCNICEGLWSIGKVVACGNDHCTTRIHEECYGKILRDQLDGPWYCASCQAGKQLMCAVCMQIGGALKPAVSTSEEQKWVHVICALTIPELTMRDVPIMEPIDGFDEIENSRFRYLCSICRKRGGASVICEQGNCNVGMHPYCAANAGCMIGTDTNPTGIYCDKHLPFDRIPGAKRYISEQDLVAEMVTNDEEKKNGQYVRNKQTKYYKVQEDYSFLQESTCFLLEKERRLLGQQLLVPWIAKDNDEDDKGEEEMDYTTGEVKPKLFEKNDNLGSFLPTGIPVVPAMAVQRMHTQRLLTYPLPLPSSTNTCVQEFPSGKGLVGAIIDVYMNDIADWARARVVAYDPQRDANYVQLIHREQKGWTILSAKNTQVLYFPSDHEQEEEFDDILPLDRRITTRVKLFRPVHKGTQQWRPKPKLFRHKSRVSSSIAAVNVTPPQKGKQAK